MTRSLVLCVMFAISVGLTAASAVGFAGWGWLATLAVYSAAGSVALVASAFAGHLIMLRPVSAGRSTQGRAGRTRALA